MTKNIIKNIIIVNRIKIQVQKRLLDENNTILTFLNFMNSSF